MALQFGKLDAIVGALHFHRIGRVLGGHHQPVGHRHGDHVGQVVLALGVAVGQPSQPVAEALARYGENAGIAFADELLLRRGVLVLDNGLDHPLPVAHDAAIAGRIGQLHGQQRKLLLTDLVQQSFEGLRFDQRYVTIENQHPLGAERGQCLRHGVPRPQLFGLDHEIQVRRRQLLANPLGAVADHHMNGIGLQAARRLDDMGEHRLAGDRMKNLGQGRTHASALTGSENDDIE